MFTLVKWRSHAQKFVNPSEKHNNHGVDRKEVFSFSYASQQSEYVAR